MRDGDEHVDVPCRDHNLPSFARGAGRRPFGASTSLSAPRVAGEKEKKKKRRRHPAGMSSPAFARRLPTTMTPFNPRWGSTR